MNTKVANVIAIELGILIALLVWLAISHFPSVQLHPAADERAHTGGSFATVTPLLKPRFQNFYAANDGADRGGAAQAGEEQPQTAPEYAHELVTEPYASSGYGEDFTAGATPRYAAVDEAPVVSSPDCYVAPVGPIVEFVQPSQIIVFSNARSCRRPNRCPARPPNGMRVSVAPQRPGGGRLPMQGGSLAPRQNTRGGLPPRQIASARPVRQIQGLKARWDP